MSFFIKRALSNFPINQWFVEVLEIVTGFSVRDRAGSTYAASANVRDRAGSSYSVVSTVKDRAGTPYSVI